MLKCLLLAIFKDITRDESGAKKIYNYHLISKGRLRAVLTFDCEKCTKNCKKIMKNGIN
jgi:hypothetical protein